MNERNKKILLPIIALIVMIGIIYYIYKDGNYQTFLHFKSIGLNFYYDIQNPGFYISFFIFIIYLSANIYSIDFFKYKQIKFRNMIIYRKGYKNVFISNIKKIAISSFIFRFLCHIAMLIIIHFFLIPINFNLVGFEVTDPILYIFSSSSIISLCIYIIYSCIGFTIFSLFIYSLIRFIKNIYVYRVSGVMVGIFGYVIPSILYNSLYGLKINEIFIQSFCYIFFTGSLLCPGIDTLGLSGNLFNIHILTLITFISFSLITYILLRNQYKLEKRNE